jgi:rfaE bifunctional protein kinase chain/domain
MASRYHYDRDVLVGAVGRFRGKRLLVVGDVILDRFIWGAVSRISPEAPVPVVEVQRETTCLGGAGNVVANVRSLGATAIPLGVVGADLEGQHLLQGLRALGAPVGGLVVDKKRATSVKTRIVAHHQQVCRADREERTPVEGGIQRRLVERFRAALRSSDGVIISDYAKGVASRPLLREILPMARAAGKVVCVDPKVGDFSAYCPTTVITPNSAEAERASGVPVKNTRDLLRAARKILRETRVRYLLVTRGEEGMSLFWDGRVTHIATVAREVFDVTGAGDTVISTLALGMVSGLNMLEAAILSNFAAGIVVGKLGTASVTPRELIESIRRG